MRTPSSTAATTPRPGCSPSSCARPASRACSCRVTARRTRRSSRSPVRTAADGAILSAPAGSGAGRLQRRSTRQSTTRTRVCTPPSRTTRRTSSWPASTAGRPSHADMNTFIGSYTGTGVSGPIAFDEQGRHQAVDDLRLQGQERQARHREPDADRVIPVAARTIRNGCGRESLPAAAAATSRLKGSRWTSRSCSTTSSSCTDHRAGARSDLRADRARLHDGVRRPAADQLRPLRGLHVRDLRRGLGRRSSSTAPSPVSQSLRRHASGLLVHRPRGGMLTSAAIALLLERVAYRPLIRRGAPKLIILISAIGASFSLAEIMGLRDQFAGWFGLEDDLEQLRRPGAQRLLDPDHDRPPRVCSPSATTGHRRRPAGDRVRPGDDVRPRPCSSAGPGSAAASGRSPRTPSPPP